MANSGKKEKINYSRVAPLLALMFVVGFGVATGAYFFIFCQDCFTIATVDEKLAFEEKCDNDPRCIATPPSVDETKNFTDIGKFKVAFLQELVRKPIIQEVLAKSIEKDEKMDSDIRAQIKVQREKEWISSTEPTPFMLSIINNDISDFLRDNLVIPSEEFGDVVFGEHILTNPFGPNVAVSIKTDNYDQSNDNWWKESEKGGNPFARQCDFDESAQMFSEDIIVKIWNDKGEFIGIMNSATPCDVTQKSTQVETKIEPASLDNITPIGNHKISVLQELMNSPQIQEALRKANDEWSRPCPNMVKIKEEINWPPPHIGEPTALQLQVLNNDIANILRKNLVMQSEEFGEIVFFEFILTDACGVIIAITERTYNYVQYPDEWWQVAKANDILARQCGWDKSVKMSSEDIIIAIYDDNEEFAGILNSATACDVILNKPPYFYGDSN